MSVTHTATAPCCTQDVPYYSEYTTVYTRLTCDCALTVVYHYLIQHCELSMNI